MDPPIQTEYLRSGGAMILIFIVLKIIELLEYIQNEFDLLPWSQMLNFLLHTVSNSWEHGGSSRKNCVGVQVLSDVNIALHDGLISGLVDSGSFHSDESWLEEDFRATESLVSDGDNLSVWKFVALLQGGRGGSGSELRFEVMGDIAEFLLDVTDDFTFGGGGEGVSTLGEDLHHVVGQVTSSKIQTLNGMWKSISLVDWDSVGDTISGIKNDSGGSSGGIEGENSLNVDIHGWSVEGLEHDLCHLFSVTLWVQWSLSKKNWMLFWSNSELIVEGVMPDLLHIIPVGDDSVLNWIFKSEDSSLRLSLISDVRILLSHSDHDSLMTWTSDDGWEDGAWSIVSGESGFAHSGSVVNNEGGDFVFHGCKNMDLRTNNENENEE